MPKRADSGNIGAPWFALIKNLSSTCFPERTARVDHGSAGYPAGARLLNYSIPGNPAQKILKKPNY
jgi:hypothetical protein